MEQQEGLAREPRPGPEGGVGGGNKLWLDTMGNHRRLLSRGVTCHCCYFYYFIIFLFSYFLLFYFFIKLFKKFQCSYLICTFKRTF